MIGEPEKIRGSGGIYEPGPPSPSSWAARSEQVSIRTWSLFRGVDARGMDARGWVVNGTKVPFVSRNWMVVRGEKMGQWRRERRSWRREMDDMMFEVGMCWGRGVWRWERSFGWIGCFEVGKIVVRD